ADEAGVLLAAPAEAGLDRAALLHQVVAVEVEADLEAQRVTGRQAGRDRAAAQQLVPQRARVLGRCEDLDTVLARIAGAADESLAAGDRACRGRHARGQRGVGDRLDDLPRARALDGE